MFHFHTSDLKTSLKPCLCCIYCSKGDAVAAIKRIAITVNDFVNLRSRPAGLWGLNVVGCRGFMRQLEISSSFQMLCLLRSSGNLGGWTDTVDKATKAHYRDGSTASRRRVSADGGADGRGLTLVFTAPAVILDLPVCGGALPRVPLTG